MTRDDIRKESTWKPTQAWQDATAHWLDADILTIEYTATGAPAPAKLQRRLADPGWVRVTAPCAADCGGAGGATRLRSLMPIATPTGSAVRALRPIRSFVLRQGRMSPAQQRALDTLMPRFGIAFSPAPLSFDHVFGRRAPRVLEIGFGMGETTAAGAQAQPDRDFLGIEVHGPGVGSLLKRAHELGLTKYLHDQGPAYVHRLEVTPQEVIDVVHQAGGVIVLSSPGNSQTTHLAPALAEMGLDGIEVYYFDHTDEMKTKRLALAQQLRLIVTGGSDFHGDQTHAELGSVDVPVEVLIHLKERIAQRAS